MDWLLLTVSCTGWKNTVSALTPDMPAFRWYASPCLLYTSYVSVLGCELAHDPQEHIFRLTGEGAAVERMSITTTLLVLILKLIYRDKVLGEGLHATVTNMPEMREYGKNTNLIARKLTTAEWREALYLMRMHQMIDVPGAVRDVDDETPIYIYGTINLYGSALDMNRLVEKYREEVQEAESREEEEVEAGEEDYNPDAAE